MHSQGAWKKESGVTWYKLNQTKKLSWEGTYSRQTATYSTTWESGQSWLEDTEQAAKTFVWIYNISITDWVHMTHHHGHTLFYKVKKPEALSQQSLSFHQWQKFIIKPWCGEMTPWTTRHPSTRKHGLEAEWNRSAAYPNVTVSNSWRICWSNFLVM